MTARNVRSQRKHFVLRIFGMTNVACVGICAHSRAFHYVISRSIADFLGSFVHAKRAFVLIEISAPRLAAQNAFANWRGSSRWRRARRDSQKFYGKYFQKPSAGTLHEKDVMVREKVGKKTVFGRKWWRLGFRNRGKKNPPSRSRIQILVSFLFRFLPITSGNGYEVQIVESSSARYVRPYRWIGNTTNRVGSRSGEERKKNSAENRLR